VCAGGGGVAVSMQFADRHFIMSIRMKADMFKTSSAVRHNLSFQPCFNIMKGDPQKADFEHGTNND
jgi:hypothetical protein